MKPAQKQLLFWGAIYTIIIFIVSGFLGIIFHGMIPTEGPDVYRFLYAGLLNFWDTFLALIVGGLLVYYHVKKK